MTPDLQFIINCCKTNPTSNDIKQIYAYITRINNQQLSDIIVLAHIHGVFPLVYSAAKKYASKLLSRENLTKLKQHYLNIVMQNMHMTSELIRITKLFEKNNIVALAFKGPALAQVAYGDITLRQFGDLDILIKKKDINKAITLLTNDRYIPEIILPEFSQEMFFSCVNVIGLEKNNRIEIHWELLARNYVIGWQESELWTKTDTISINGTKVPMLPNNSHLLYLCVHGSKHLFERLEWVSDIDRFIRAKPTIDWPTLITEAQAKGIERILLLSLYLCHELLDLPLPKDIPARTINNPAVKQLGTDIIKLHLSTPATQGKSHGNFWLLWRMRERTADRVRFAFRGMFSPKFDDFKNISLPKQMIFLYPILRPIRLLIKYL